MRTNKFRGLKKSDNTWIVGDLNHIDGKVYIFDRETSLNSTDDYEVHPETVGQFMGLQDKNGVDIYEGDKVSSGFSTMIVVFQKGAFEFVTQHNNIVKPVYFDEIVVIGNIHENTKP